jgi:predicted alpha/beta-hydrolase family hydrolase
VREQHVDLAGHPGLLVRPADARWLYVLAHGAGAGMRHVFMVEIAEALAARAVATLRWVSVHGAGKPRPDRRGRRAGGAEAGGSEARESADDGERC